MKDKICDWILMCIFQIIFTAATENLFQVKQDSVTCHHEEVCCNLEIEFVLQVIKCPFAHDNSVQPEKNFCNGHKREFQADKCQK